MNIDKRERENEYHFQETNIKTLVGNIDKIIRITNYILENFIIKSFILTNACWNTDLMEKHATIFRQTALKNGITSTQFEKKKAFHGETNNRCKHQPAKKTVTNTEIKVITRNYIKYT